MDAASILPEVGKDVLIGLNLVTIEAFGSSELAYSTTSVDQLRFVHGQKNDLCEWSHIHLA